MAVWIFQGRPSRYDVAREIEPGKVVEWSANQYSRDMNVGDVVFFWRAAENEPRKRGIYGWGVIMAIPEYHEGSGTWVRVRYEKKFPRFIPFERLKNNDLFSTHQLFRMPIGTNFRVSDKEVRGIFDEVRELLGDEYLPGGRG